MKTRLAKLAVLLLLLIIACKKDSENYILRHYTKRISGNYNWHGEYHGTVYRLNTKTGNYYRFDSISTPFRDTFTIKTVNNTTINVNGNDFNFIKLNNPINAIIYERISSSDYPRSERVYYYYKDDSITYTLFQKYSMGDYYYILHTP